MKTKKIKLEKAEYAVFIYYYVTQVVYDDFSKYDNLSMGEYVKNYKYDEFCEWFSQFSDRI